MQHYELQTLIDKLYLRSKNNWEQARLIAYIVAQVNSKKKLKLTDVLEFPWENQSNKENQKVTDNQKEQLLRQAQEFEKLIKQKENGIKFSSKAVIGN